jgi:hypothetical protein
MGVAGDRRDWLLQPGVPDLSWPGNCASSKGALLVVELPCPMSPVSCWCRSDGKQGGQLLEAIACDTTQAQRKQMFCCCLV